MAQLALVVFLLGSAPVDFDTEVVPVLTKFGCNAASCHGAAAGRDGFKLSLFGGDPAWDYDEIARRLEGRRISNANPADSLIVTKPTEQVSHGGGQRLEYEGAEAELLTRWVQEGAGRLASRRLLELAVEPSVALTAIGEQVQLRVMATFDDGSRHEVSDTTVYTSSDPAAVAADDAGQLTVMRRGQHTVIIRFLDVVQTVQLTVPLRDEQSNHTDELALNWIDEEVQQSLRDLRLCPSTKADDATLLRRLTLHLTGRLPRPEQVHEYLRDDRPDKYSLLVERLLGSPEFVDYWTYKLAKLLRIRPQSGDAGQAKAFYMWLRQQVADDVGWDAIASELLLAEGDTQEYGPANFYLVAGDARGQAEFVSELLMGVRLRCANCHNHPLDRWTQDDYHGLAAIFARIERGRFVRVASRGEVIHPGTGEPAVARVPGERYLEDQSDARQELAAWLTNRDNPYFALAFVNRLWKSLMGRGLTEPTDDLRATNPATHAKLLQRLAGDFIAHDYSPRHVIRVIVNSAAYQRGSRPTIENKADDRFYSHALTSPLEAEVLADAIADVTDVAELYGEQPLGTRAINLYTQPDSMALEVLGRCSREDACEDEGTNAAGLSTKLHLVNGSLLNRRISDQDGRLQRMLKASLDDDQIVQRFYVLALCRPPSDEEIDFWRENLHSTAGDRVARLEDFVWSLLNSQEFQTNH